MADRLVVSESNFRRIQSVDYCFGMSGIRLAVPGRVLIGDGILTKMCRKKPKQRQFLLFNDILVYGNIVVRNKKYNKQRVIPLEEIKLESIEDEKSSKYGWVILSSSKSFVVYAETQTEKAEWMTHIQHCVTDLLRKSGKKAVETYAPVRASNAETIECQICRNKFSFSNPRHHCRKCGFVVCGTCSKYKVVLPMAREPVRICNNCFVIL